MTDGFGFLIYVVLFDIAVFFVMANIVILIILGIGSHKYHSYFVNKYFILGSILGKSLMQYANIFVPIFLGGVNILLFFACGAMWVFFGIKYIKSNKKIIKLLIEKVFYRSIIVWHCTTS